MFRGSAVSKILLTLAAVLVLWNLPSSAYRAVISYWGAQGRCPDGYVLVSGSTYVNTDFCVAKYEMKNVDGLALSKAADVPWTGVTRSEAVSLCRARGAGYDLMTNNEWQTVARNIAATAGNWSGGTVNGGELNRGHSDGAPAASLAASSDGSSCAGTGQSCSLSTWNSQRRTFRLSTGDVIWDFAGNAGEWLLDDNGAAVGANAFMSTLSTGDLRQARFGHNAFCASPSSSPYCGYGYGTMNAAGGAVIRGGNFGDGVNAGIFAVDLSDGPSQPQDEVGFRCVYRPKALTADACVGTSTAGTACNGGTKYAGGLSGTDFMVTPGGCTDSPTPACANTTDSLTKTWGSTGVAHGTTSTTNGEGNTATLDAGWSNTLAAKYCASMIYGGYDDWFLPATNELNLLYTNRAAIGAFAANKYWSSTHVANNTATSQNLSTGVTAADTKTGALYVRCLRKMIPVLKAWLPEVTGLDVADPATTSSWKTVTITNAGQKTTVALTTSVTAGFALGSDNCNGQTLAVGASCTLQVRATGVILDGPLSGTLTVASGTDTVAVPLSGTSSGHPDPCLTATGVGTTCEGGALYGGSFSYGGGIGTRKLMVTPGGCTDSTTPTCAGGADATTKAWGTSAAHNTTSTTDGLANTATLDAGWSDTAAAKYCADMTFAGYDDWYLPALNELQQLYTNRVALGGFASADYWSSTHNSNSDAKVYKFGTNASANVAKTTANRVRCVRRFAGLEASPTVINSLNVVGPSVSSGWKRITVSNTGTTTTGTLTTSITGSYLQIDASTNTCVGHTLASGATCTVDVRAANVVVDLPVSGSLTISDGTLNATVTLSGTVTGVGDPCAGAPPVGTVCYGGSIFAGVYNSSGYMVTPGGCTDSATPTCGGGTDSLTKAVGGGFTEHGTTSTTDGIGNTVTQAAFGDAAAAKYCANMVYGGYDDWFLPARDQLSFLYGNKSAIGGFANAQYWSSTSGAYVFVWFAHYVDFSSGATNTTGNTVASRIRCMRAASDYVPNPVDWADFVNTGTAQTITSVSLIDVEISVAASGAPIAWYRKNGGAWNVVAPGSPVTVAVTSGTSLNFMVSGTNGSTATFTVKNLSDSSTVLDTVTGTVSGDCGGQWYGGYCWYLSDTNENCTSVCSTHGGYHAATRTFAGDQGSNANCGAIMNGLGSPAGTGCIASSGCENAYAFSGCHFSLSSNYRCTNGATNAGYAGNPRACACNQ